MIGASFGRAVTVAAVVVVFWATTSALAQTSPDPAAMPQPPQARPAPPELVTLPIDALRARANGNDISAMEELGRRLIQGSDTTKDPQAGAGWLLRAAELGSAQSAFNVGVMYERGFVVERDSSKAVEWYRKAADANLAVAKHNLALLLREGKGAPRDVKTAVELLRAAARQGTAASMFTLGDIYDRGDAGARDATEALAWFAVAAEFDRQVNGDVETPLAKTATQRAQALQRTLTPEELARAQDRAQGEFRTIIAALSPPPPEPVTERPAETPFGGAAAAGAASAPSENNLAAWPSSTEDQVRAVQQLLFELKFLRGKADGAMGPATRAAIRDFQKANDLKPSGELSKDLYLALRLAYANRDVVSHSPLPTPAKVEESKKEAATPPAPAPAPPPTPVPKQEVAALMPAPLPPAPEPPPPPPPAPLKPAELARAISKSDLPRLEAPKLAAPQVEKPLDIGQPPSPPAPPTSAEIAKLTAPPPDLNGWPTSKTDQIKAIQSLLQELKIYNSKIDGVVGSGMRNAIRDYERMSGLKETGEPSKVVFESLKEMRALMGSKR